MSKTKELKIIVEPPKRKTWPYLLGGFVAGVASIIGLAYALDDEDCATVDCVDEVKELTSDAQETV